MQSVLLEETIERLAGEFCKYIKVRIDGLTLRNMTLLNLPKKAL